MSYIATIGFFDGVHRGHQALLNKLREFALLGNKKSIVFTFITHPKKFFNPDTAFPLLSSNEERIQLLANYADQVIMLDFSKIHSLTALQFLQKIKQDYNIDELLLGFNNFFGSDKIRDLQTYEQLAQSLNITIRHLDAETFNNENISSTRIRKALSQADIELANQLLGYNYCLQGTVVHGKQIGRQIGFPTANLQPDNPEKLIPADAVYAVKATLQDNSTHIALANIGFNPTFGNTNKSIEVHIPNFNGSLYQQKMKIQILDKIRDELKFNTTKELQQQIFNDIQCLNNYQ